MTAAGYKTYIIAALIAVATGVKYLGYIDDSMYQTLLALLGAGGLATMRASVAGVNKKLILIPFLILTIASPVFAQQPPIGTATQRFEWDQEAPTLTDAQGYTYKYYPDNATAGIVFQNVTCSGTTSPFVCSAPIPAFTPGNHTITVTATNIAGESPKSNPFDFNFVVTPSVPRSIRIISGG